jgi:excisionase family DNA binding protein
MNSKSKGHASGVPFEELADMMTAKELEALLKIDQKTIYRYVACGLIPYVRIQSNIRFVKQQIANWIEKQNYCPQALRQDSEE